MFVAGSLTWGIIFDGFDATPDLIGAAIALIGAAVIIIGKIRRMRTGHVTGEVVVATGILVKWFRLEPSTIDAFQRHLRC